MPRVNVDEPWLMERAYQVMRTGVPSQPMLGLKTAYLLQVGYGYLLRAVDGAHSASALLQARLLQRAARPWHHAAGCVDRPPRRRPRSPALAAALFLALDSNFLGGVAQLPAPISRRCSSPRPRLRRMSSARQRVATRLVRGERRRVLALAMLCHGNAFWVGSHPARLVSARLRPRRRRAGAFGYWFIGGAAADVRSVPARRR